MITSLRRADAKLLVINAADSGRVGIAKIGHRKGVYNRFVQDVSKSSKFHSIVVQDIATVDVHGMCILTKHSRWYQ